MSHNRIKPVPKWLGISTLHTITCNVSTMCITISALKGPHPCKIFYM